MRICWHKYDSTPWHRYPINWFGETLPVIIYKKVCIKCNKVTWSRKVHG